MNPRTALSTAIRRILPALLVTALAAVPAQASFFQIQETCPTGLGSAFAGEPARAEDACTVWANPAGMMRLDGDRLFVGVHSIQPSLTYDDDGSTIVLGLPLSGGDGGDAGEDALVPNVYYTHKVGDRWAFGIGVNAPFGLATEYDSGWIGRYHALRSDIEAININPSVAFQVSPGFSIGLGLDYQMLDAELSQAVDFGTACFAAQAGGVLPPGTCASFGLAPQSSDGIGKVTADDDAFGWNAGLLWEPNQSFRIGVSYRSELSYDLDGDFTISTASPGAAAFAALTGTVDAPASASIDLPDTLGIGAFFQATRHVAILADATRTGWSSLPELRIHFDSGASDSVTTLGLEDSWRYGLGANWTPSDRWGLRFGVASDESPVPDARRRSVRLPDADRMWYTVGLDLHPSDSLSVGIAYGMIDIDSARVNKVALPGNEDFLRGNLRGTFDFSVDIISVQASWSF
ncbi:MAG: outer membrane protein transport protein [Thermoanaerobaculia bacterium]